MPSLYLYIHQNPLWDWLGSSVLCFRGILVQKEADKNTKNSPPPGFALCGGCVLQISSPAPLRETPANHRNSNSPRLSAVAVGHSKRHTPWAISYDIL